LDALIFASEIPVQPEGHLFTKTMTKQPTTTPSKKLKGENYLVEMNKTEHLVEMVSQQVTTSGTQTHWKVDTTKPWIINYSPNDFNSELGGTGKPKSQTKPHSLPPTTSIPQSGQQTIREKPQNVDFNQGIRIRTIGSPQQQQSSQLNDFPGTYVPRETQMRLPRTQEEYYQMYSMDPYNSMNSQMNQLPEMQQFREPIQTNQRRYCINLFIP
jgi:hypothetical protein